jgi:hypothetical protein
MQLAVIYAVRTHVSVNRGSNEALHRVKVCLVSRLLSCYLHLLIQLVDVIGVKMKLLFQLFWQLIWQ